ncbi:MAG: hypothetical protein ACPGWR_10635, partial [Ardenticatenaceae bacterium]
PALHASRRYPTTLSKCPALHASRRCVCLMLHISGLISLLNKLSMSRMAWVFMLIEIRDWRLEIGEEENVTLVALIATFYEF